MTEIPISDAERVAGAVAFWESEYADWIPRYLVPPAVEIVLAAAAGVRDRLVAAQALSDLAMDLRRLAQDESNEDFAAGLSGGIDRALIAIRDLVGVAEADRIAAKVWERSTQPTEEAQR